MKKIFRKLFLHRIIGFSLNKNYAVDISYLRKIRDFSDGIDYFEFHINSDFYNSDHKPSFDFYFIILNIVIFSIDIYYKFHRNE